MAYGLYKKETRCTIYPYSLTTVQTGFHWRSFRGRFRYLQCCCRCQGLLPESRPQLFEVGLPGLDFPGILSVGPTFSINANAVAELGITADLTVAASISLPELQFAFPASEGQSSADVNPKDARESPAVYPVHFSLLKDFE